jgi:hypothetical protein
MKTAHRYVSLVPLLGSALTGCSRAPSIDIIGSFFPVWMLCLTCAVILTFFARMLLARYRLESLVGPVALFYPCLLVALSCLLWLFLFR